MHSATLLGMLTQLCKNIARLTVEPFRERGAYQTFRAAYVASHAWMREQGEGFDRRYGTETSRSIKFDSFLATGDDVMPLWRYFATLEGPFDRIMGALDESEQRRTFVDLGCGKGKALLLASDFPFRRIVGVELSPALLETARRNVRVYRSPRQRCREFELVRADAAEWEAPTEDLVVYLFQPFPAEIMAATIGNLERSLDRHPRAVSIVYQNPLFRDAVMQSGRFRLRTQIEPAEKGEFQWEIYSNAP
jgi:SAM-dependent methyltransferase